jgi:hypothetical protein
MDIPPWVISLVVGLATGGLSSYIGIQIGFARIETWRDIRDGHIDALMQKSSVHNDDLIAHDFEIGALMKAAGIERISRQRLR